MVCPLLSVEGKLRGCYLDGVGSVLLCVGMFTHLRERLFVVQEGTMAEKRGWPRSGVSTCVFALSLENVRDSPTLH